MQIHWISLIIQREYYSDGSILTSWRPFSPFLCQYPWHADPIHLSDPVSEPLGVLPLRPPSRASTPRTPTTGSSHLISPDHVECARWGIQGRICEWTRWLQGHGSCLIPTAHGTHRLCPLGLFDTNIGLLLFLLRSVVCKPRSRALL